MINITDLTINDNNCNKNMRINRYIYIIFLGLILLSCNKKPDAQINAERPGEPELAEVLADSGNNAGEKEQDAKIAVERYSKPEFGEILADNEDNTGDIDDNMEHIYEYSVIGNKLVTYHWRIPIDDWGAIKFEGNTYWLGRYGEGGEPFCYGTYELGGINIRINYPDKMVEWLMEYEFNQKILEWMFPSKEATEFIFDEDYIDFDVTYCLRNGDKVLKNHALRSPVGEIYILDEFEVIKYDHQESHIIILENLRMREKPDVTAPRVELDIYLFSINKNLKGSILYRNSVYSFDAVTVKEDIIDGIKAPWYHVIVGLDEVYSRRVWVFGGYVRILQQEDFENNRREYYQNYFNTLYELKVIE